MRLESWLTLVVLLGVQVAMFPIYLKLKEANATLLEIFRLLKLLNSVKDMDEEFDKTP